MTYWILGTIAALLLIARLIGWLCNRMEKGGQ